MKDKESPYIKGSNNVPTKEELDRRHEARMAERSRLTRSLYEEGFWVPKKTKK